MLLVYRGVVVGSKVEQHVHTVVYLFCSLAVGCLAVKESGRQVAASLSRFGIESAPRFQSKILDGFVFYVSVRKQTFLYCFVVYLAERNRVR